MRFKGFFLCMCFVLIVIAGFVGCKGETGNPTIPSEIPTPVATPSPNPTVVATPTVTPTPTPSKTACDNYGESADASNLLTLEVDKGTSMITMDCTGDIDWYKIRVTDPKKPIRIQLSDLPFKSDFDMIVYNSSLQELENGRSAQSGSVDEMLTITPNDTLLYLQIYSYNGRGDATLTVTTKTETNPTDFIPLSYESVLSTYFSFYPRGTKRLPLEQSVETMLIKPISCQIANSQFSGELTIGNYAHVARNLLTSGDYVDGWSLVVFHGSEKVLQQMKITLRVTILNPNNELIIKVPFNITLDGNDYLVSATGKNVYYLSQSYGDFLRNSNDDIQISSGIVSGIKNPPYNIFTQQVEVEWQFKDEKGIWCSGNATGKSINDFEIQKLFSSQARFSKVSHLP